MRTSAQPVEIRTAEEDDLPGCLALDDSYTSTHTWRVEVTRGEPGVTPLTINSNVTLGEYPISITFRPVKLPRPRKVVGTVAGSLREGNDAASVARIQSWKAADLVLLAEQGSKLCGYLVLTVVPSSGIGWISSLVVATSMRQKGIGSMLMAAARRWSRYGQGMNIRNFMLEVPTKNYPAVAFVRSEGFNLCGYTDYSFSNGDVMLMFASQVVI
jgi:ribosomal protein S18 acetylase RimI-like enzyme